MSTPKTYFAAQHSDDLCTDLWARVDEYGTSQVTTAMFMRAALAFRYYYGFDPSGIHGTSGILRGGEQGELAEIRVNHSRALVQTLLNLVVNSKLVWTPRATNRDNEAMKQTELASALLEYYWSDKKVSKYITRAVEEAITFTEGFVLSLWDETLGEDVAPDPDNAGQMVKSGDLVFSNVSTWDVIRDPHKPSYDSLNWVIVRTYRNKYDLAAKHPKQADKILTVPVDMKALLFRTSVVKVETDDIPCYYFFHKRTAACPDGRQSIFVGGDIMLDDGPLDYKEIPLFRVSPAELISTPYGYSAYLEILGMQEALDSTHSSILTNISTFATQNIIMEQGSEVPIEQLSGGVKAISVPPGKVDSVKALQLTAVPQSAFQYIGSLQSDMELIMGLNSVVRGTTPGGPKEMSGSALALLQSQALQQSSVLAGDYVRLVESLGTHVISVLKARASVERQVAILGRSSKYLVQQQTWTGADLNTIDLVKVDAGNPLSQTGAGRAQIAEQLIQMHQITTPEQYDEVLRSGRIEPLTHAEHDELMQILAENEQISNGQPPQAMLHDDHVLHCKEHRSPTTSPNARMDPGVVDANTQHIHDHYQLLYGTPPMVPAPPPPVMPGMQPPPPPMNADGSPVMIPEPMYIPRMRYLCGLPPVPPELMMPMMPPPGLGPPPGASPQRPPGPPPVPPKPPLSANGVAPSKLPMQPKNPSTNARWNGQDGGGAVVPPGAAS